MNHRLALQNLSNGSYESCVCTGTTFPSCAYFLEFVEMYLNLKTTYLQNGFYIIHTHTHARTPIHIYTHNTRARAHTKTREVSSNINWIFFILGY